MGHIIIQAKERKKVGNQCRMKGSLLGWENGKEGLRGHLSMGLIRTKLEKPSHNILLRSRFSVFSQGADKSFHDLRHW
jgi:hypothetical protein